MAFDATFIEEQKRRLLEEKVRLEGELSRFARPTGTPGDYDTKMENIGEDEEENVTEVEAYVDNLGVEATLEKELGDVLAALEKIERNEYGICEKTGQEISTERLKAYPAARTAL